MKKEAIKALFPEIYEIQSPQLQEYTVRAFQTALERGGWDANTVLQAPVTLNWSDCRISLVEHIRDVTAMAIMSFDYLKKYYAQNDAPMDRDTVICGALLHDLGKFTEFMVKEGEVQYSDNHDLLRHPLSGAILAAMAGLPDQIIHLIAVHSFEGNQSYQTNESSFVRKIDEIVFENGVCGLKKNK